MSETARFEDHEASRPWFRQPWFWFLVLFPAASITYCIVAITLSMTTHTSMVVDDYSKEGLAINQSLARDAKAAELGLEARIQQTGRNLEVTLAAQPHRRGPLPGTDSRQYRRALVPGCERTVLRLAHQG